MTICSAHRPSARAREALLRGKGRARHWSSTGLAGVAALLLLASCSLERRQPGPSTLVRLELPDMTTEGAASERVGRGPTSVGYPTAISDFSCLLVRVSGEGITPAVSIPAEPSACATGDRTRISLLTGSSNIGIISAPLPLSGGNVGLDVPIGTRRTFQILGVVTSTGSCPSTFAELESAMGRSVLDQLLAGVTGSQPLQAEAPVVLASTTADVSADATITLSPSYAATTAKPVFCDGIGAPAIVDASVTSVAAASSGSASIAAAPASVASGEAAAGALDAVIHVRFNKAVSGFAAADVVPQTDGVQVLSVAASALREFDVTVRVTPSSVPAALKASEAFLGLALSSGGVSDLFGMTNASATDDFSSRFADAAGSLWDVTAPTVTGLSNDASMTSSKTWTWGCSEDSCTYRYLIDSTAGGTPSGSYGSTFQASQMSGTGTYYLHVQAMDASGNESEVVTVSAVLGTVSPSPSPSPSVSPSSSPSPSPSVSPSSSPSPSPSPSSSTSPGPSVVISNPESTSYSHNSSFTISGTCTTGLSVSFTRNNVGMGYTPCVSGAFSYPLTADTEGMNTYGVTQWDAANTTSVTAFIYYTYDVTAPTTPSALTLQTPSASPGNDTTPTIRVSGVASGDTVALYTDSFCSTSPVASDLASASPPSDTIDLTSSALPDGIYVFYAKATDAAGNASSCSTLHVEYEVDTSQPSAPASFSLADPVRSPGNDTTPKIRVSGVSDGDTVAIFTSSECAIPSAKGSGTVTGGMVDITSSELTSEGAFTFYAQVTDPAGNVSDCSNIGVVYVLDTTRPTIIGLSDDSTPTRSKSWSWECSESVCTYRYLVDGTSTTSPSGGYATTAEAAQSSGDGTYYLHVEAMDEAGNVSSSVTTVSAILDNTAPTVGTMTIYDAISGSAISSTVWNKVKVAASGASDTVSTSLQMNIDSSGSGSCYNSPDANATWVTYSSSQQSATLGSSFALTSTSVSAPIVVRVRDEAGNIGCASSLLTRTALTVDAHFTGYPKWNDYVTSGSVSTPTSPTACTSSSARTACVHAGAYRKIALTGMGLSACADLTSSGGSVSVSDTLGLFSWSCTNPATYPILTATLASGTGLTSLLDFDSSGTNRWKSNAVTITRAADGATASTYSGQAWWTNSFSTATLSSGTATTLSNEGEILMVGSSQDTYGITIAASKVAVVVKSGASLTNTGTSTALISATGSAASPLGFLWIEGPGTTSDSAVQLSPSYSSAYALSFSYVNFGVVRGLRSSAGGGGFKFSETNALTLSDLAALNASSSYNSDRGYGFFFSGSTNSYTSATGLTANGNGRSGIYNYSGLSNFEFTTLRTASNTGSGIVIANSSGGVSPSSGKFSDIISANNGENGLVVTGSSSVAPVHIFDFRVFNNTGHGVALMPVSATESPNGVALVNGVAAFNGSSSGKAGIYVGGASGVAVSSLRLVGITSVNNIGAGISLTGATYPMIHDALLMGNGGNGLQASSVQYAVLSQIASIRNSGSSFYADATGAGVAGGQAVGNILYDSGSSTACPTATTGLGLYQSGSTCGGPASATFTGVSSSLSTAIFTGSQTSDSSNSCEDSSGYLNPAATADWANFENAFRLFGPSSATLGYYSATSSRSCTASTSYSCLLYDVSLYSGDAIILGAAYSGASSSISCSSTSASASMSNTLSATSYGGGSTYWHKNAIEKMGDTDSAGAVVGNDNGLCETGEACVYAPNFGAYQGHGTLATCSPYSATGTGVLTSVTMYSYPSNGR